MSPPPSLGNFKPLTILFSLASVGTMLAFGWSKLNNVQPEPIPLNETELSQLNRFFQSTSPQSQPTLKPRHPVASQPQPRISPSLPSRAAQLPAPIFSTESSSSTATPGTLHPNPLQEQLNPQGQLSANRTSISVPLSFADAIALYWTKQTPLHTAQWSRIQQQKAPEPLTRSLSAHLKLHLFPTKRLPLGKLDHHQWRQLATQATELEQDLQTLLQVYEAAWQAQAQLQQSTAAWQYANAIALGSAQSTTVPPYVIQIKKQYQQAQQEQKQAQQQLLTRLGLPNDIVLVMESALLQHTASPLQDEKQAIQTSLQLRYDYLALNQSPDVTDRQRLDREKQIAQVVRRAIAQTNQAWQTLQQRQQQQRNAEHEWRLQAALPNGKPEIVWQAYDRWHQAQLQTTQAHLQYHRSHWNLAQVQGRLLNDWGIVISPEAR
ncbi:MAG: hypothetical protein F6J87_23820 [Spirulina sp. SIO3F2]|nr:hypothetical protein [Spirulina sp. SIO3F2]